MFETKFIFIGKIFLISFLIINFPALLPFDFTNITYYLVLTTTIFDTASLLVLSLSISKFVHFKNLKLVQDLNNKNNIYIEKINLYAGQINNDNKLSFILAIFFTILTLIQPLILVFTINRSEIYASSIIKNINNDFISQKEGIEKFFAKDSLNIKDKKEIGIEENRIDQLSRIKDKNIEQFLKQNNRNKFENVKIIIRNFLLGALWALCFYKIYKV